MDQVLIDQQTMKLLMLKDQLCDANIVIQNIVPNTFYEMGHNTYRLFIFNCRSSNGQYIVTSVGATRSNISTPDLSSNRYRL